ncbi:Uncharacterised protein [Candidatus Norongarragalina meridionalis]|nr:Uncharacterised protein [Candidatus Norongarragalina meridionalis]
MKTAFLLLGVFVLFAIYLNVSGSIAPPAQKQSVMTGWAVASEQQDAPSVSASREMQANEMALANGMFLRLVEVVGAPAGVERQPTAIFEIYTKEGAFVDRVALQPGEAYDGVVYIRLDDANAGAKGSKTVKIVAYSK